MPQTNPMNKKAESQLMDAVRGVSSHVEGGMSPTDAVVKAANDFSVGRDMIPLMVQAYNTGRTAYQQDSGDGILGKQADFPIAHLEDVFSSLYPSDVPSPASVKSASAVSGDYSRPPAGRPTDEVAFEKAAHAVDIRMPEADRPASADPSERLTVKVAKAFGDVSREKKALDAALSNGRAIKENYLASLGLVREYFKSAHYLRKPFSEVEHNSRLLFGEPGVRALEYAYVSNNMKEARAQGPPSYLSAAQTTEEPYSLVAQAIKCGKDLLVSHRELKKIEKAASAKIAGALRPFDQSPSAPTSVLGDNTDPSLTTANSKQAGLFGNTMLMAGGAAARGAASGDNTPDELVQKAEASLSDPEHLAELREIETTAMLQDLMTNDEVISGYDPEETLEAYNEISALSPRASTHTAVIRPLLRKRLTQGAMEPFEAQQMADIEKTLGQTQQFADESIAPNPTLAGAPGAPPNALAGNSLLD